MYNLNRLWAAEPALFNQIVDDAAGFEDMTVAEFRPELLLIMPSSPTSDAISALTPKDYVYPYPEHPHYDHDHHDHNDDDHGSIFESGTNNTAAAISASGNPMIDGVLIGYEWTSSAIDYAFSLTATPYDAYTDTDLIDIATNMTVLTAQQETNVHFILDADTGPAAAIGFSAEGLTNLTINNLGNVDDVDAQLRFGNTTSSALGTARVADFPGDLITNNVADDGDIWFGPLNNNVYQTPEAGNYAWATHIHEVGHALGLAHGHNNGGGFAALPTNFDSMEYSIMTYRSYVNAPLTGYPNETWGFAQSFMMSDIAALQYMYGADFTTNSGNTTYSWNPNSGDTLVNGAVAIDAGGNRIFATIWDGDGIDTYDLSAYATDLQIDLSPGGHSLFSAVQQSNLGNGNFARGNIFNAFQYDDGTGTLDARSLIENAIGGTGDDSFVGNAADNSFTGGTGTDTVDYSFSAAVTVNLDTGTATGSDIGTDTLISIENVTGSVFGDNLTGDAQDNTLNGGFGVDTLNGGAGDDTLQGGQDNDTLNGDSGVDTLLGDEGDDTLDGGADDDMLFGGLGVDILNGGAGDDMLYGGNNDAGGGSTPSGISFGSGQFTRAANAGNDSVANAIDISAMFSLNADADIIDSTTIPHVSIMGVGDAGTDVHFYAVNLTTANTTITLDVDYGTEGGYMDSWVEIYDSNGNFLASDDDSSTADGEGGSTSSLDSFLSYTTSTTGIFYFAIGRYSNLSNIPAGADYELQVSVEEDTPIVAMDVSNDTLNGGEGNDRLQGEAGDDTLDGGDGVDTAVYLGISTDYTVIENPDGTVTITDLTGSDGVDTLANIEFAQFSNMTVDLSDIDLGPINLSAGDDDYTGTSGDDVINALEGNDFVYGAAGNDTLNGGDGNDFLRGDAGDDSLDGGFGVDWLRGGAGADALNGFAGQDWADYITSGAAVTVDLLAGTGTGGDAQGDSYQLIERVYGSNFDDTISGDNGTNYLRGAGGDDTLNGGAGTDYLQGDAGADVLNGGDGGDFAYYVSSISGLIIDLANAANNTGEASGDSYISIENVFGSRFDDVITGDSANNFLRGFLGNDQLTGGDGDDFLRGDQGSDVMDGGVGRDWAYYATSNAGITVDLGTNTATGGHAEGDSFTSIERVFGSNLADSITGDSGANYLRGSGGNDLLFGGGGVDFLQGDAGADTLDGGAGTDWAYYASATSGLTLDLSNTANNTGEAAGDSYISIENIFGSRFNDNITGDSSDNYLRGFLGDDIINGGAGNDTLRGDSGADIFVFETGTGSDTVIDYDDGDDMLDFSEFGFVDAADALSNAVDVNGDVVFTIGTDIITIENTTIADITDNLIV